MSGGVLRFWRSSQPDRTGPIRTCLLGFGELRNRRDTIVFSFGFENRLCSIEDEAGTHFIRRHRSPCCESIDFSENSRHKFYICLAMRPNLNLVQVEGRTHPFLTCVTILLSQTVCVGKLD